jgi:hypothetical protein
MHLLYQALSVPKISFVVAFVSDSSRCGNGDLRNKYTLANIIWIDEEEFIFITACWITCARTSYWVEELVFTTRCNDTFTAETGVGIPCLSLSA